MNRSTHWDLSHPRSPVPSLHLVLVGVLSFLALCSGAQKYRSVNLGGWLVVEGWITPGLFDGVQDRDLMVGHSLDAGKSVFHRVI